MQAHIDPDGVPVVGKALGPTAISRRSLRKPGLIVHPRAEAGCPVGTVTPGAVAPQPPVVGDENGEDAGEPFVVRRVAVVLPLGPRHHVRACARRIEALEAVPAVEGRDLPTDEPVGVLAGVEIVQGALEVEGTPPVAGEQQDERRIPHEQAVIESRIDKARHKTAPRLRTAQIAERQLPRPTVTGYGILMSFPEGLWQQVPGIVEGGRRDLFRGHPQERVLLDQRFPEVSIDVAVVCSQPANLLVSTLRLCLSARRLRRFVSLFSVRCWQAGAGVAGWFSRLPGRLSGCLARL